MLKIDENTKRNTSVLLKGAALLRIEGILREKKSLYPGTDGKRSLISEIKNKIASQVVKADALAIKFRTRFDDATTAYKKGDGARAHSLSSEGKLIKGECESLNTETSKLQGILKKVIALNEEYDAIVKVIRESRRPKTEEQRIGRYPRVEVELFLDSLPQCILALIGFIQYQNRDVLKKRSRVLSEFQKVQDSRALVLYRHVNADEKATIAREIGTLAYESFMNQIEIEEWERLHSLDLDTSQKPMEVFAEAFANYYTEESTLMFKEQQYRFMQKVIERLHRVK